MYKSSCYLHIYLEPEELRIANTKIPKVIVHLTTELVVELIGRLVIRYNKYLVI